MKYVFSFIAGVSGGWAVGGLTNNIVAACMVTVAIITFIAAIDSIRP